MPDLSTTYLGLNLPSPLIVGSSGLTDKPGKIVELEKYGAGAVVLKSIFEEEILMEYEEVLRQEASSRYKDDFLDYFDMRIKEVNLNQYLDLITDTKKQAGIPVIASINCSSSHEWTYFAEKIESAGADALELNIMFLPSDTSLVAEQVERTHLEILRSIRNKVKMPIAVKVSQYFTNLAGFINQLSRCNIEGIVLFNRFYNPDFDIDKLQLTSTNVFSSPGDLPVTLRWIAIMSGKVSCDLAASTGVHDDKALIKQLLAGATAVQVVSALYQHGPSHIGSMLSGLKGWMAEKGYEKIPDFRGLLSQKKLSNPGFFERVQFMKYFSDRDKNPVKQD